jgi:predicted GNAT family acetyltransferase
MPDSYRVVRHDPASFCARALPWLMSNEAENNLLISIALELRAGAHRYQEPLYLATIERGQRIVGCAFRTPPYKAGLTGMPAEAAIAAAADLRDLFDELPAIMGPREPAAAFAAHWLGRPTPPDPSLAMRVFELTEVTPPPNPAPGELRLATPDDLSTATRWIEAFGIEADIPIGGDPDFVARHFVDSRELYLWRDAGDDLCMAVATGPTEHGIRIGFVYTPPERRGRGYASVLVSELSQRMLDAGRAFCFLYTDLANPTSNAIYQRLGYRPVADVFDFLLDAAPGEA